MIDLAIQARSRHPRRIALQQYYVEILRNRHSLNPTGTQLGYRRTLPNRKCQPSLVAWFRIVDAAGLKLISSCMSFVVLGAMPKKDI
jgi:hypothetical protein